LSANRQAVDREQREVEVGEPVGDLVEFRDAQAVRAKEHAALGALQHEGDFGRPCLAGAAVTLTGPSDALCQASSSVTLLKPAAAWTRSPRPRLTTNGTLLSG
jgi:hypothetical protein